MASLEKRAVVSSFIFRFPRGQAAPEVALFKRSAKVRTYQHHLAPISGSIDRTDKTPLSAAWRELREETTLTAASLSLWRTGKPFTFSDASVGREWTVHPFAFRLQNDNGDDATRAIHTDWEHESWGWYDPQRVIDEIGAAHGVPRLTDSLRRVWFEGETGARAGQTLATGLERLRTDHESGSRELTAIAMRVFGDFIAQTREEGGALDEGWWRGVRMAAWHLVRNGRESMGAATLSAVLGVLAEMESILAMQTESVEKWKRVLAVVDAQLQGRSSRATRLQQSFAHYLQSTFVASGQKRDTLTVLTTSASSTIRDSLLNAYAALDVDTLELRVLESRPLFEGATLAASVLSQFRSQFQSSDKHLRVRLYTDASVAVASEGVDIVLLGADQISATKGVSNKTGSLPLALSAKHISPAVKIAVLSEVEKINGTGGVVRDDHAEDNDPMEIVSTWTHDGVKGVQALKEPGSERATVEVQNVYFEWVPLDMVDAFVCEEGVLSEDDIRQRSEKLGELSQRYFGDL